MVTIDTLMLKNYFIIKPLLLENHHLSNHPNENLILYILKQYSDKQDKVSQISSRSKNKLYKKTWLV